MTVSLYSMSDPLSLADDASPALVSELRRRVEQAERLAAEEIEQCRLLGEENQRLRTALSLAVDGGGALLEEAVADASGGIGGESDPDHPRKRKRASDGGGRSRRVYRTGRGMRRTALTDKVQAFVAQRLVVAEDAGVFLSAGELMAAFKAGEGAGDTLSDDDALFFFQELRKCVTANLPGVKSARTWSRRGYRGLALRQV